MVNLPPGTLSKLGGGVAPAGAEPIVSAHLPGVTALPYSSQKGPGTTSGPVSKDLLYETTAEITSASDLTCSQAGAYLVGLYLRGGATPGWLQLALDGGVFSAILPVPAQGLDATGAIGVSDPVFVPTSIGPLGSTMGIPSGAQTFGGGLAAVQAVFSSQPNPHARFRGGSFSDAFLPMRGVAVTGNESGTAGTAKTYTVPGSNTLQPKGFSTYCSIQAGTATGIPRAQVTVPATAPFTGTYKIPCSFRTPHDNGSPFPRRWPLPSSLGPASTFTLTHQALTLAGATDVAIAGYLFV